MWYRVFGTSDAAIEPEALLDCLRNQGYPARGHFHVDDEGWFQADLECESGAYEMQRYLATEDGFRDLLNTWAAGIELIDTPHQTALMQHMIATRQIFTLRAVDGELDDRLCRSLCEWLAARTAGIYQIDGQGYFSAAGERLARDEA